MVNGESFFQVRTIRRLRSALMIGHSLTVLGLYMALVQQRPYLWILDAWGDIHVPVYVWPALLGGVGVILFRTRRPGLGMLAAMAAFVLLVTFAAAAYLTSGMNALSVLCAVLAFHSAWTATDFKTLARERMVGRT